MLKKSITKLRDRLYDHFLGNRIGNCSTSVLYGKVIDCLPDNCKILDVGFGNGSCVMDNLDKIKEKNIKIDGIDIDKGYITAANSKISEANAQSWVTATEMNMLDIDNSFKWDFILFSESYPVIPRGLMSELMIKARNLTNRNDGILFMHNLCDHPTKIGNFLKNASKFIIMVDFGRYTSMKDFEEHIDECGLAISEKKVLFQILQRNYPTASSSRLSSRILFKIFGAQNDQAWRNNNQWYIRAKKVS